MVKKNTKIKRVIFAIIITLIVITSFLLYNPPEKHKINNRLDRENNITIVSFEGFGFDKPSPFNIFRKITSPFNLEYYDYYVLFRNVPLISEGGCRVIFTNASFELNQENITVLFDKPEYIGTFKTQEKYNWGNVTETFNFEFVASPNCMAKTDPQLETYAKINIYDALGNMLIFVFAYLGLVLLVLEIFKKFRGEK